MRRGLFALLGVLATLAIAGCGDEDGGDTAEVDADSFQSCLRDGGLKTNRESDPFAGLEAQPVTYFSLADADGEPSGAEAPFQVAVFDSEGAVDDAEETLDPQGGVGVGRSGLIFWAYVEIEDQRQTAKTEKAVSECAEEFG